MSIGDSAYARLFAGKTPANPHIVAGWATVSALLAERAHTVDELIEATGLHRRMIKGFIYFGRRAGQVREVDAPRREEVTPDLTMVRTVRAFRLTK